MSASKQDLKSLPPGKQELLRALASLAGEPTRGQIRAAMNPGLRPSVTAVAKWLDELRDAGWVRNGAPKQVRGSSEAATWSLAVPPEALSLEPERPKALDWPWLSNAEARKIANQAKEPDHYPVPICFVFWGASGSSRSGSLALNFAEGMARSGQGRQVLFVDLDLAHADPAGEPAHGLVGLMGQPALHEGERLGERLGRALRFSEDSRSGVSDGMAQVANEQGSGLDVWLPLASKRTLSPDRYLWVLSTGLSRDESATFALHRWLEERVLEQPRSATGVPKVASVGVLGALRRPSSFNVVVVSAGSGRGLPALLALSLADMLILCGPPVGGVAEALLLNVLASRHLPLSSQEPGVRIVGRAEDWSALRTSLHIKGESAWLAPLAGAEQLLELGERLGVGAFALGHRLAQDPRHVSVLGRQYKDLGQDVGNRRNLLRGWMKAVNPARAEAADCLLAALSDPAWGPGPARDAARQALQALVAEEPVDSAKLVLDELQRWTSQEAKGNEP